MDKAVKEIIMNPNIGEQKKGDLSDIWVYKFRAGTNLYLLAYKLSLRLISLCLRDKKF